MPKKLEITFDMAKNIANEKFNGKYSYDKFSFKNMTIEEIKGNKYNIFGTVALSISKHTFLFSYYVYNY